MHKIFIVIALVIGSSTVFSFEHLQIDAAFKTQDLVKMKLWYEGIEKDSTVAANSKSLELPEELLVPLSKFKF